MTPPLVGLIGRKRSGKDTVASVFVDSFGWQRTAFADPLKEMALRIDPYVGVMALPGDLTPSLRRLSEVIGALGWERSKDYDPEVRHFLEVLGTDGVRTVDQSFWLRLALERIDSRTQPVIVTDCRFRNEAEAIRERGGYIVRVRRPATFDPTETHPSAIALDHYPADFTINNTGSLAKLEDHAEHLAEHIELLASLPAQIG